VSTLFKSSEVIMSKPLTALQVAAALAVLVIGTMPAIAETGPWQTRSFPAPNGGSLVYRIVNGNPECASYDGRNCLWGQAMNTIRFGDVRPLVCGADHRTKWGVTGYNDPRHWCSLARPRVAQPSGFGNDTAQHPAEE
jgi:hypothetical protein